MRSASAALLFTALLHTISAPRSVGGTLPGAKINATYFVFAQQWSSGFCRKNFEKKGCVTKNVRNFWTIHGLWPSGEKSSPAFCKRRPKYNATALEPLVEKLQLYWPSLFDDDPNHFWKHQWRKHGTCAASAVPQLATLYEFFNATLSLFLRHNFSEYLRNSGVDPSSGKTYSVEAVRRAFEDDLETEVALICYEGEGYAEPLLAEIRMCLDTQFRPINCTISTPRCGGDRLYYLPFTPNPANLSPTVAGRPSNLACTSRGSLIVLALLSAILLQLSKKLIIQMCPFLTELK